MNTIEKESLDKTGLRSDVVTLYQGGLYHLYRFKKYTDVRLVFAPEQDIAFFGGDPDNFEYPRFDLDICFFRVYENGKPAKIEHYPEVEPARRAATASWCSSPAIPGKTDRLNTVAHLEYLRDTTLPFGLDEAAALRSAAEDLQRAERRERPPGEGRPVRRARTAARRDLGGLAGLQDPAVMKQKAAAEAKFRDGRAQGPEAEEDLRRGLGRRGRHAPRVERNLPAVRPARTRLGLPQRAVRHRPHAASAWPRKRRSPTPSGCASIRESNLESLKQQLFSEAPIYDDLETLKLADALTMFLELAGAQRPAGAEGAGRQVAAGAGGRTDRRHEAGRRGRAQEAGRRRAQGHRGVERPDDRAGAAGRSGRPARSARPSSRRSKSRSARPTASWPTRGSRSTARTSIPTPRSRSAWRSAW